MKKILFLALLVYGTSCSNPEDRATGDPDSTSFNTSEEKVLNSKPGPTDPNSQTDVEKPDTSSAPAVDKKNVTSSTQGTNRSYGSGKDSGSNKSQ